MIVIATNNCVYIMGHTSPFFWHYLSYYVKIQIFLTLFSSNNVKMLDFPPDLELIGLFMDLITFGNDVYI